MEFTETHIEMVEEYLGVKLYPYQKVLLKMKMEGEEIERETKRKESKVKGGRHLQAKTSNVRTDA